MSFERTTLRASVFGDLHLSLSGGDRTITPAQAESIVTANARDVDVILLTGDMIHTGKPEEAAVFGDIIRGTGIPTVAVLGNHETLGRTNEIVKIYEASEIQVLQGEATTVIAHGVELQLFGLKGGYDGTIAQEIREVKEIYASRGRASLHPQLETFRDFVSEMLEMNTVILTHYATTLTTAEGEDPAFYELHGSTGINTIADFRAESIRAILHGHTHKGKFIGQTKKGIPVRNTAFPVLVNEAGKSYASIENDPPVCIVDVFPDKRFDVFISKR